MASSCCSSHALRLTSAASHDTFRSEFAESLNPDDVDAIEASLPPSEGQTPESRQKIAALIAAGGLSKVARLDCCVSVVDCTTFMDDFSTTDFLTDRHGDQVTPEDERNITDLLVDQIEFANVILLNKIDVCSAEQVKRVETLVKTLNPCVALLPSPPRFCSPVLTATALRSSQWRQGLPHDALARAAQGDPRHQPVRL